MNSDIRNMESKIGNIIMHAAICTHVLKSFHMSVPIR